jgi:hypothetical protein
LEPSAIGSSPATIDIDARLSVRRAKDRIDRDHADGGHQAVFAARVGHRRRDAALGQPERK